MNEAEAERRLAEIQRGRRPHALQSTTQLKDLEIRLKQTAVWGPRSRQPLLSLCREIRR